MNQFSYTYADVQRIGENFVDVEQCQGFITAQSINTAKLVLAQRFNLRYADFEAGEFDPNVHVCEATIGKSVLEKQKPYRHKCLIVAPQNFETASDSDPDVDSEPTETP